jgi:hypothetical protein
LCPEIPAEEGSEPGTRVTRHNDGPAAVRAREAEDLVRDAGFTNGPAESSSQSTRRHPCVAEGCACPGEEGPSCLLAFDDPGAPVRPERSGESLFRFGISGSTVFEQAGGELRQYVDEVHAKPSPATEEPADIGNGTIVSG